MLCCAFLLVGRVTFAANDGSVEPSGALAAQTDADIETLLREVEQQVLTGHAMSPSDDSAMETWQRVLMREKASPNSQRFLAALASFAAKMRMRAADEKMAGRMIVSSDLMVFADQATRLLGPSSAPTSSRNGDPLPAASLQGPDAHTSTGPGTAAVAGTVSGGAPPVDGSPSTAPAPKGPREAGVATPRINGPVGDQAAPVAFPGTSVTNFGAALPTEPAVDAARADAVPAPSSASPIAPARPDKSPAAFFAKRGDEMLAIKDITAARKFYEYAANAGNAHAATSLARTLDSEYAAQLGVLGLKPDPALAKTWYGKAAALGDPEAMARLHALQSDETATR